MTRLEKLECGRLQMRSCPFQRLGAMWFRIFRAAHNGGGAHSFLYAMKTVFIFKAFWGFAQAPADKH